MAGLFIAVYRYFHQNRLAFYLFLAAVVTLITLLASRIRFEENITGMAGKDEKLQLDEYVIRNFRFAERIILHLRFSDTLADLPPETLTMLADTLGERLLENADPSLINQLMLRVNDTLAGSLRNLVMNHLPVFLDSSDYLQLDTLLTEERIARSARSVYRILVTPAGMALGSQLRSDPLGISGPALKKLRSLQISNDFTLYDGYVVTPDLRHLLVFLTPSNPPGETAGNARLIQALDRTLEEIGKNHPEVTIDYFGSPAVAVGNAGRIKNDILLTLILAVAAIILLIGFYFRNFLIPVLGFLPAFFGGGLALSLLYLFKGSVSVIALGIGSVILGLIIDYALYIINHYLLKGDPEVVLREMADTVIICALTSIGAFLCLTFLDSAVLHDLGWFASLSVAGAALFALVILPPMLGSYLRPSVKYRGLSPIINKIGLADLSMNKWVILPLAGITVAGIFFMGRAGFEPDMNALNYLPGHLRKAQEELEKITPAGLKNIYIVATGNDLESALRVNQRIQEKLEKLQDDQVIHDFSGAGSLLLSDSVQQKRLDRWNQFWKDGKKQRVLSALRSEAGKLGFSAVAFDPFDSLLSRHYTPISADGYQALQSTLFSEWIHQSGPVTMISSVARGSEREKQAIYEAFDEPGPWVIFDRYNLTTRFVKEVKEDFELLVTLSMIFVSLLLLISFGRIELGIMAALPMFLAWLITLGFMGVTGTRFNIFNIIVSSFIFGLGVDYSILMARGMLAWYKTGHNDLTTYRVSILLSSATTLLGVAALFFARHPALNSIALISVVGMAAVVLVTLAIEPLPARWFLLNQQRKAWAPVPLRYVLYAIFVSWIPITMIALSLVLYGILISPLLPLRKERKQELFHRLFTFLSRAYIILNFPRYHKIENPAGENFSKPAIIISNHQSLIETPALLRMHPRIVIITNEWVFRNPVFGPVARLAGFITILDEVDDTVEQIRHKMEEGYSVLVFPEGHRSVDGRIQRFHRGAFYFAEKLKADLLPVIVFGSGDFLRKGNFWGRPNRLFMRILPRITPENMEFGDDYSKRTRKVRRYYKEEYARLKAEKATPEYYRNIVLQSYLFKGPVLEWYVRVKMMLEENFEHYHRLLPAKGDLLDLGCGYGYITLMLMLSGDERHLTGVDYDEEKIQVAANSYLINKRIRFVHADVMQFEIKPSDGILLGDTLHYLTPEDQQTLLTRCVSALKPGGVLLIREADAGQQQKHQRSKLTEFFSTRGGFNKTKDDRLELHFTSETILRDFAEKNRLTFETIDTKKKGSNRFFRFTKYDLQSTIQFTKYEVRSTN